MFLMPTVNQFSASQFDYLDQHDKNLIRDACIKDDINPNTNRENTPALVLI